MTGSQVIADAAVMLAWLRNDIAERGGSGRRPWRVLLYPEIGDETRAAAALRHLIETRQVWLDPVPEYGWTYVTPTVATADSRGP